MSEPSLFGQVTPYSPLADRMRPTSLDEFLGQEMLVGEGRPLREAIVRGEINSIVFWGPPGSGKTTLAFLISKFTNKHFEPFSAVMEGVPRVREIINEARQRRELEGRGTILFCDEIHRFNKAQQDAFLPWVEQGVITLIGATTENPSFELTNALLSRLQVHVLEPLSDDVVREVLSRALNTGTWALDVDDDALDLLVRHADGDARVALNALEAVLDHEGSGRKRAGKAAPSDQRRAASISLPTVEAVLARRLPSYDKSGEQHYNIISALHKAIRGSDVDGALYWLARMIDGGEDPLYIARRMVRMASEDVGLADPRALTVALAAKETYHFLGSPEGELALAEAAIYLATAPKSNRVYTAWAAARKAACEHPAEPVPLHIRNAPTALMKELGYGRGYQYDHQEPDAVASDQEYLPRVLRDAVWYEPTDRGYEKTIGERLAWFRDRRRKDRSAAT